MSAAELEIPQETEEDRVVRWRVHELERAGYEKRWALFLALRSDVDLHRAVDLLARGCDPSLAVKILA